MAFFVPASEAFQAAVRDRTAMRALRVRIDVDGDGDPEDVTPLIDWSVGLYGGGRAQDDLAQVFTKAYTVGLRNAGGAIRAGAYAGAAAALEAKAGEAEWIRFFTGFVSEAGASRTRRFASGDAVTLELVDASSTRATRRRPETAIYLNYRLCDPADTDESLFHLLAAAMGYAPGDLETAPIERTKDYLPLAADRTLWAELQDLVAQYAGHLAFRYDGKLRFISRHQSGYSEPTSEWTFAGHGAEATYNIHEFGERRLPVLANRWRTAFDDYERVAPAQGAYNVVYRNTDGWDAATERCEIVLAAGAYWPGPAAGDVARLEFKDPASGEAFPLATGVQTPTLGALGAGADIEYSGAGLALVSFNGSTAATHRNPDSAEIILRNTSGAPLTIRKLQVRGEAIRVARHIEVEEVDATVTESYDYLDRDVAGKYGVSPTQAHTTLRWLLEYTRIARKEYGFPTDFTPQIQEGALVTLDPEPGTSLSAWVTAYEHTCKGPPALWRTRVTAREYLSYAASGDPSRVVTVARGQAATESLSVAATYAGLQDGYDHGGGVTAPAAVAFTRVTGLYRAVALEWQRQLNLTNLDHFELQTSDDGGGHAYALRADGLDWKGLEGEATEVAAESHVHANIPLAGAPDDPVGRLLYYRVRQVTRAGAYGPWSAWVSATIKAVGGGDLAADSIYANNIRAGEIRARELMIGDTDGVAVYAADQVLPAAAELFDLSLPDCASHANRQPVAKRVVYEPPAVADEAERAVPSGWTKWADRGVVGLWRATANLLLSPTDLADPTAWTGSAATAAAAATRYGAYGYTRLTNTGGGTAGYRAQAVAGIGTTASLSVVLREGTAGTTSRVGLYDVTNAVWRGYLDVDWAAGSVAATGLSNARAVWLVSEAGRRTVGLAGTVTTIPAGATVQLRLLPCLVAVAGAYLDAVCPQVENAPYPTPFTVQRREAGRLDFRLPLADPLSLLIWVRPGFPYTVADAAPRVFSWYLGADQLLLLYYRPTDRRFAVLWANGGTSRTMTSEPFTSDAALQQWHHLGLVFHPAGGAAGGALYLDGEEVASGWSGTPNALTADAFLTLGVGQTAGGYPFDGWLTDLVVYPGVLSAAAIAEHCTEERPYYDGAEVANALRTVRISRAGIRLHNNALSVTDQVGRQIDISNAAGLLARDVGGTVIHDIPDAPVLLDMIFGGHLLFRRAGNYFHSGELSYTDTQVDRMADSSLYAVALSAFLPPRLSNAKGLLVTAHVSAWVAAAKCAVNTRAYVTLFYSTRYGVAPDAYNYFLDEAFTVWAAGYTLNEGRGVQVLLPIVWADGAPYLVYRLSGNWVGMGGASGNYRVGCQLFLHGVTV